MRNQRFEEMMNHISRNYSTSQYQRISGDARLERIPKALQRLWRSEKSNIIDVGTMYGFYSLYNTGFYTETEFETMLTSLEAALSHEFELLYKANTEERRMLK